MGKPKRDSKTPEEWISNYGMAAFETACARGHVGKQGADKDFASWCAAKGLPHGSKPPPPPVTPPSPLAPTAPPAAPPPPPPPVAPAAGGGSLEPAAPIVTGFELPASSGADLARGEVSGLGEGGGFLEADFNEVRSTSDGAAPASSGGGGLVLLALAAGGYFLLRKKRRARR